MNLQTELFSSNEKSQTVSTKGNRMKGKIYHIGYDLATSFLITKHYSGRKPQISKAFGWYDCEGFNSRFDGLPDISHLKCVVTFGKPASRTLCDGICGKDFSENVYELNRLCRVESWVEPISQFLSACLRALRGENWIIVSYADTEMNHHWYIYQACNFIYTGETKSRTDMFVDGLKHHRHSKKENQNGIRKVRSAKHRYVYICGSSKNKINKFKKALKYESMPYPKGENKNYVLGEILKPNLIKMIS